MSGVFTLSFKIGSLLGATLRGFSTVVHKARFEVHAEKGRAWYSGGKKTHGERHKVLVLACVIRCRYGSTESGRTLTDKV